MTSKNLKFYNALYSFFSNGSKGLEVADFFNSLIVLNFETATEVWEFLLSIKVVENNSLETEEETFFCDRVLSKFLKASRQKTITFLKQNLQVSKKLFIVARNPLSEGSFSLLKDLIISQKFEDADFIYLAILKNPNIESILIDIERLYESIFDKYKTNTGAVNLPKRVAMYLISCAEKIKGPKSALLMQKVKVLI